MDSKSLLSTIDDILGKGKYHHGAGISNGLLGADFYMNLEGNVLEVWNADSTFALNINLVVMGRGDGSISTDGKTLAAFLRKISGEIQVEGGDTLTITSGTQRINLPRITQHSDMGAITRIKGMLQHIVPTDELCLPLFGEGKFEAAFKMKAETFSNAITMCEMIKSGIYKLDFSEGQAIFSSQTTIANSYSETLQLENYVGEPATVEWSGPLHKFFRDEVTFYVKDDFPLVLLGSDRKLIKAPHIA